MKLIKLFLIISLILNINCTYAFDFKKFNPFKKKQPEQKAKMVETKQDWLIEAEDIPLEERKQEEIKEPKSDKKYYYPTVNYIFEKYNYPPGKRELNIDDVKKNLYSYPYIVVDSNCEYAAYPRYFFYPETNQISSEFYVEKLDTSKSKQKRILEYNHNSKERYPIIKAGMKENYKNLFNGLTLVDWSKDNKKLLIKEKTGSTFGGIYRTYLYIHFLDNENEKGYTIKLTGLNDAIEEYFLDYDNMQMAKYLYDIEPQGFSAENDNLVIVLCYIYDTEGKKLFMGSWGYDIEKNRVVLLSKTKKDFSISTNGLILKKVLD